MQGTQSRYKAYCFITLLYLQQMLLKLPHRKIKRSGKRVRSERKKYRAYRAEHGKKPLYYRGREKWTEIPREFL